VGMVSVLVGGDCLFKTAGCGKGSSFAPRS
jgi:hypothetical protein